MQGPSDAASHARQVTPFLAHQHCIIALEAFKPSVFYSHSGSGSINGELFCAAVGVAEEGCRALGMACGGMTIADKAALSEISGLASRTTEHLSGVPYRHPLRHRPLF